MSAISGMVFANRPAVYADTGPVTEVAAAAYADSGSAIEDAAAVYPHSGARNGYTGWASPHTAARRPRTGSGTPRAGEHSRRRRGAGGCTCQKAPGYHPPRAKTLNSRPMPRDLCGTRPGHDSAATRLRSRPVPTQKTPPTTTPGPRSLATRAIRLRGGAFDYSEPICSTGTHTRSRPIRIFTVHTGSHAFTNPLTLKGVRHWVTKSVRRGA